MKRKTAQQNSAPDTRNTIIEAAERLCGMHGLHAVSVRDIAAEANVHLAAVNYHFGSKMKLLLEIIRVRSEELEAERAELMRHMDAGSTDLRSLIRALLLPLARWRMPDSGRHAALQFFLHCLADPTPEIVAAHDAGARRLTHLVEPFQRVLPHLSFEEICWRIYFTIGIEHMSYMDVRRLAMLSDGRCKIENIDSYLDFAIDYAEAGFRAPARLPLTAAPATSRPKADAGRARAASKQKSKASDHETTRAARR